MSQVFRAGRCGSVSSSSQRRTMFRAYGHIQANRLRSGLLLAGFVALALLFSLLLIWSALLGGT